MGVGVDPQGNHNHYYIALITRLEIAKGKGVSDISIKGDSKLVCNQVDGSSQVKAENLKPFHNGVEELKAQFTTSKVLHVSRSKNRGADRMSKAQTK